MRFHSKPSLLLIPTYLAIATHALPAAPSYSVVDVDGSNAAPTTAPEPATTITAQGQTELSTVSIFRTITTSAATPSSSEEPDAQPQEETTVSVTVVPIPASEPSSSSEEPSTPIAATTTLSPAEPETLLQTLTFTTTENNIPVTHTTTTTTTRVETEVSIQTSLQISTELQPTTATATTTATPSTSDRSTSYYDNGMWHTTYAIPADPTYAYTWPASHWEQEAPEPAGGNAGWGERKAVAEGTGGVGVRGAEATGTAGEKGSKEWKVVSWNETGA
ncbi:hypothetical protein MBLNU230_g1997t1 [Neophaeotheca triangularis]